jgi:acyl carrier protein
VTEVVSEKSDVVVGVLAEVLEVPAERLTADTALGEQENWDSMAALEVLVQLESRLGIRLDLRAYHTVRTVGELVELAQGVPAT